MLHIDTLYSLLLGYVDANVAPKFSNLAQRTAVYSMVFVGTEKKDQVLSVLKQQYLPTLGITDEHFNVDITFLEKWANHILQKNNGEVEISRTIPFLGKIGYIADREDLQNFITLLKEHDNEQHEDNNHVGRTDANNAQY